ncbi:hypothetical protein LTR78_005053 [Recurvomyces mirabilis]|uniref:DNA2/NAM7 helicase-like C-terminal domain-containing protein n=1 Tax=Recurvomyces mirabilis TaxID=574656 RepID=A0AAE1C271_9PEZI|nr:hypothetical protein LTR78_005053 [Recurvomyces mirabilis]KAK5158331.1 hypothetical protein LTS14_003349 [Recurvomyces mirabilis]
MIVESINKGSDHGICGASRGGNLAKCHVILATLDTLSLLLHRGRVKADVIMVDDVSQMTVPQFNLAVQSNPTMRHMFIFGDPLQHGSRPKSRSNSSEFGVALNRSPFEAFFLHSKQCCYLMVNYRNPPAIVNTMLPKLKYPRLLSLGDHRDDDIIASVEKCKDDRSFLNGKLATLDLPDKPFVWVEVDGELSKEYSGASSSIMSLPFRGSGSVKGQQKSYTVPLDSPSRTARHNPEDIDTCLNIVRFLVKKAMVHPTKIVVISNYARDADVMNRQRRREDEAGHGRLVDTSASFDLHAVRICTVDSFRSDEADVVIWHLVGVEQNTVPYVSEPTRVSVAMSRVKQLMFLVGPHRKLNRMRHDKSPDTKEARIRGQALWRVMDFFQECSHIVRLDGSGGSRLDGVPVTRLLETSSINKRKHGDEAAAPSKRRGTKQEEACG